MGDEKGSHWRYQNIYIMLEYLEDLINIVCKIIFNYLQLFHVRVIYTIY